MSRESILSRVRAALTDRPPADHPGHLEGERAPAEAHVTFVKRFRESGGEVQEFSSLDEARAWLEEFARDFESVAVSSWVPSELRPGLREEEPQAAELGVSLARLAIAETGSLILDSREGRAVQLLPPTHLVWVWTSRLRDRLSDALEELSEDLPAALALHSGPSRSADIGQITVHGVHGPGRVVAAVVPRPASPDEADH